MRKPYAAAELRQLATAILADPAAVDDLMKRVDEKVKERLKPAQANSGSSKATPPGGHNWSLPIITINLSAIGLLGSILWLRRRRRARDNNIAIS